MACNNKVKRQYLEQITHSKRKRIQEDLTAPKPHDTKYVCFSCGIYIKIISKMNISLPLLFEMYIYVHSFRDMNIMK